MFLIVIMKYEHIIKKVIIKYGVCVGECINIRNNK